MTAGGYYKDWVNDIKKNTLSYINKLMTGNITVAQAHAERDIIVSAFNELAEVLEGVNEERTKAQRELFKTQEELRRLTKN